MTIHEGDRANHLTAVLSSILHNDSSSTQHHDGTLLTSFVNGEGLIVGYQRLGSLENTILRQMEGDVAVLPYPMLYSSDRKYVTSVHDTTEMGFIPTTVKDLEFISTVTEVLNRETASIVLPKYYKESLQVQCVDDPKAAYMIDIIHDNFDNSFILAYNNALGNMVFDVFYSAASDKREFSAAYAGTKKVLDKKLTNLIARYEKYNSGE